MALDPRWKNPQGRALETLHRWAEDVVRELRKGDYLQGLSGSGTIDWDTLGTATSGYHLQATGVGNDPVWAGFLQTGTGANARTWNSKAAEWLSVRDFGAIGDGVTDDTAPFQEALTAAIAGGKSVFIPDGTYYFDGDSASLDPGIGPIAIVGQSRGGTILKFDEESSGGTSKDLFNNTTITTKHHVEIRNMTVRGTMFDGAGQEGTYTWQLNGYPSVLVENCKFTNIACIGPVFHGCDDVQILNNEFEDLGRGAIRVTNARKIHIIGNRIERSGDDPFSLHVGNASLASDVPSLGDGMVVTNNLIRCCPGSIKALGGRVMNISDNILQMTHGIQVGDIGDSVEGSQQPFAINICDNIVLDSVRLESGGIAATQAIGVFGTDARGAAATNSTIPYQWDTTGTVFIKPWDWRDADRSDTAFAVNPIFGVRITGNVIARTLPNVADVDDLGYGDPNSSGTFLTTAITDSIMRPLLGINIDGEGLIGVEVCNNVIMTCSSGLQFEHASHCRSVKVSGNVFFDCSSSGITWSGPPGGQETFNAVIASNFFNLDPFRVNTNSNTDGTYDANGNPIVFNSGANIAGMQIIGNQFANACQIMNVTGMGLQIWRDNVQLMSEPTALAAFNAANEGIGTPQNIDGIEIGIIDADPTSATYFQSFQRLERAKTSIPTTGWYPIGWFTRNLAPSLTAVSGWIRRTTGTGHTIYTDWLPVPVNTSAPTDNNIMRADGTNGNIQPSGVSIDDSGNVTGAANVYVSGGTDVPVTDGGTGASTAQGACANLHARYLASSSGAATSVGATTAETVLATIAIPANSLGANGFIEVETGWTYTNSGNNKTMQTRFGASGAGTGGTSIKSVVVTTTASLHDAAVIQNRNATNSQVGASAAGLATHYGAATGALTTAAIDTTAASEVVITGTKANSGETLTLEYYRVWITA